MNIVQFDIAHTTMKYILIAFIAGIVIWMKPWKWGEAPEAPITAEIQADTSSNPLDSLFLLPANQVINNEDSELEVTEKFDNLIQKFMKRWELKGASFALMKDDRLIYSKGYGYADEEAGIPMDVMHVFRIASVSKLITAAAIMKLQEENKLHLTDRVFGEGGILNDSLFLDIKDKRSKHITVEHLLRHQGGFTRAYGDPMFCPLDMIEKVSGEDYETYIRKHILLPAGCFDMHLGKNLYEDKLPNEVRYYEASDAEPILACDGSGEYAYRSNGGNNIEELYGAGGWVASPSELLRFLAAIDNDPAIPDILSPESIEYMTRHVEHGLPIGWMNTTERGVWTRSGTLAGTSAMMKRQPNGYSWVFLTNTSCWKGSRFPSYIDRAVTQAMNTVDEWPTRDLFEMQNLSNEKLLVIH